MTSDLALLQQAKEQVAKENYKVNWNTLVEPMTDLQTLYYLEQAAKVALQLQRDQMNKLSNDARNYERQTALKQITDLKAELAQLRDQREVVETEMLTLITFVKRLKYMDGSRAQHEFTESEILSKFKNLITPNTPAK